MAGDAIEKALQDQYGLLSPHLDERGRRLLLGSMAAVLGAANGSGVARTSRLTGAARQTISRGMGEVTEKPVAQTAGRARLPGGGRKPAEVAQPGLTEALDELISPTERGDPGSPLRWTTKSTHKLSKELGDLGYSISQPVVGKLLRSMGYSLQANAKTAEGARQHQDRDTQFAYINELAAAHLAAGQPLISVDTRRKEQVGNFAGQGREWQRVGEPVRVHHHDFPDPGPGRTIPYGVHAVAANTAMVNVGTDHDTAAFAVASIRRWWQSMGAHAYPDATSVMITSDVDEPNDHQRQIWKWGLAQLAAETGLDIIVCHHPPGTSKWNKIEHRLFSHVSMNWRGRPLIDHHVMIELIADMNTPTDLKVNAQLDRGTHPTGTKISDARPAEIVIDSAPFHGEWNYTIKKHH
jgi:Rhodopirellula transposase DDE domain